MPNFFNKYPYTDFHELNLDWIIKTVKETVAEWAVTLTEWHNTQEEWQQLYDYVHDYFDNLDVQQEINNKLDQMALDGSLATIAQPIIDAKVAELLPDEVSSQIGDTVSSQLGATVALQLPDAVSSEMATVAPPVIGAWLDDHITQPTTPAIDTSLSVPGAAADAAATGSGLSSLYDLLISDIDFTGLTVTSGGYINASNGNVGASALYSYTDYIDMTGYKGTTINITSTLYGTSGFAVYDENNTFIAGVSGTDIGGGVNTVTSYVYTLPVRAKYIRFSLFNNTTLITDCSIKTFISDKALTALLPKLLITREQATAGGFAGDFDNLTDNIIIGYSNTTGATNKPFSGSNDGGTLLVCRGATGYNITTIQLFIRSNGNVYTRILWGGGWTDWNLINNSFETECYFTSLSQYTKMGVIGDSYASGYMFYNGIWDNNYPYSWGQNIARRNGITCINFSYGGLTTKSWLTHARGLSLLNSSPAQNIYFVSLGLNDQIAINDNLYTLGDATDYANKTDTFYGNYAKIIDAIQAKAPNARIVLCTVSEGDAITFAQVSTAIKEIGTLAGVPVLDVLDDPFMTSTYFYNSLNGGHPTAASYAGYGLMIERLFSKCAVNNAAYFTIYPA